MRGIERMVDQSRPCPEILIQLFAARGALDEVERLVLRQHLRGCLLMLTRTTGSAERECWIEEILAMLGTMPP